MVGSERLFRFSGGEFNSVLDGADVTMAKGRTRKILLTGTCWYELTGLWHLLSAQGDDVYCTLKDKIPGTPK
ncbi:hypothetical protein ACH19I_02025 [Yersinia kristensenii]|uniref:hypothetical protein n=1 Tax=Yersinia kristensenii TaxID=28152 RepID=UPI003896C3EC